MKDLTSSEYVFENLIQGNFLYIDKTEYIWRLVRPARGSYFLSRPRRFGKSLTISTLKAIFQGKRELFKGLAIDKKPYDWLAYPIIHLSLNGYDFSTVERLEDSLCHIIDAQAVANGLSLEHTNPTAMFQELVSALSRKAPVVLLVDEYDKPILDNISSPERMALLRVMKNFFSVIKDRTGDFRFIFVTGVTKFCHVSLFSDLNNLQDISMNAEYATMLGYTQAEVESCFGEWLAKTEERQSLPHDEFLAQIKSWYDGYRFVEDAEGVYNPVSLASFFENCGKFSNYWFATGTPSFLMELIRRRGVALEQAIAEPTTMYAFGAFELDNIPPLQLLLQTGYLTIKSAEKIFGQTRYRLDFPNREVSESFNVYLLNAYSRTAQNDAANFCLHLAMAIAEGNMPKFQKALEVFFAGIPYDVHRKNEANFQNIFFAIFKLLGYNIHTESKTSDGRIDAIIETDNDIYLFEFKLNKDDSALAQIKEKEYFKPYLLSPKKLTLVGANFDTTTGRLADWKCQEG